jgi:hypothetical protein
MFKAMFWSSVQVDLLPPYLCASEVMNLCLVSRLMSQCSDRWRTHLSRRCRHFFGEAMCEFLYTHRCVVTGSALLHVLEPGPWTPNDLDVFAPIASDLFHDILNCGIEETAYNYLSALPSVKQLMSVANLQEADMFFEFIDNEVNLHFSGDDDLPRLHLMLVPVNIRDLIRTSFDLDFLKLAFDGRQVSIWAPTALRTHASSFNWACATNEADFESNDIFHRIDTFTARGYSVTFTLEPAPDRELAEFGVWLMVCDSRAVAALVPTDLAPAMIQKCSLVNPPHAVIPEKGVPAGFVCAFDLFRETYSRTAVAKAVYSALVKALLRKQKRKRETAPAWLNVR